MLLRGKALRAAFVLRALAIERWVRAVILLLLGVAVIRLRSTQVSLKELFAQDLTALQPFFRQVHFNVSDSATVEAIQKVLDARQSTLALVAAGLIGYAALQLLEGIGLWSLQRWGEYVAVVGTTIFVPLEVYEVVEKVSWLKVVALVVNIAAVLYLIWSKRLFGFRGGHAAYRAALHEESLLEVEDAAEAPRPAAAAATP